MPPKKPVAKTTTTKPAAKTTTTKSTTTKTTTKPANKAGSKTPAATNKTTAAKEPEKKEEPAAPAAPVVNENLPIKQLGGVLAPDPGLNWCKSGKWPCLLDPTTTAGTFLRYRDTNYLQAVSPNDMDSERIRLALLGGLRYGKPMVIDLGEIDRFDMVTTQVNKVQDGLMDKIIDKSVLTEEVFKTLVRDSDGDEYKPDKFTGGMADKFVFIVIMAAEVPPPDAGTNMFFILVQ